MNRGNDRQRGLRVAAGLAAAIAALGTTAHAATTPEQLCEAGKNRAAANYIACLGKAEKTYVATGDATLYGNDLAKCESGYAAKWGRLERKAEAAGTTCPSTGDQAAIQNFADSCAQSVAVALGGGALPLDAVACNANLGTCNADLSTTNADLGTCNTNLTTCGTNLGTCAGNLASTNADLGACNADLSSTNADLGACQTDLGTANSGTAAAGDVLAGKSFTSGAGLGSTGTMPNNGAVTLTPGASDQAIATGFHDGAGKCAGDADLVATNIKSGVNLFGVTGTVLPGGLPKTGQTVCYSSGGLPISCTGSTQDGEYQKGVAASYTDNGDGTVTDNLTGLMWEKLSDDGSIHDMDTTYTWANAFAVKVAGLNSANFAGHNDWRLPNVKELDTLKNYGTTDPLTYSAFNSSCAPGCTITTCSCTKNLFHWASTNFLTSWDFAWGTDFGYGYTYTAWKGETKMVRAVRAGS